MNVLPDAIQTYTGRLVRPLALAPGDVALEDIAHALAQKCRFTGHTRAFYSVAQHSVLVSRLCPPEHRLLGLLHDAAEAYLPDIASPVKRSFLVLVDGTLRTFDVLENTVLAAILWAAGIPWTGGLPEPVQRADLAALATEARDLMRTDPRHWNLPYPPADETIQPLNPHEAERLFLREVSEAFETTRRASVGR